METIFLKKGKGFLLGSSLLMVASVDVWGYSVDLLTEERDSVRYEIKRADIERSPATSVPELLRMIPGFYVGHYSGSEMVASTEGLNNESVVRMNVYVDDIPINLPSSGVVYWNVFPVTLDDIDRIVYYPGFVSDVYGESGIAGTLRIYTRNGLGSGSIKGKLGTQSMRSIHVNKNFYLAKEKRGGKSITTISTTAYIEKSDGALRKKDTEDRYGARIKVTTLYKSGIRMSASINAGRTTLHKEVDQDLPSSRYKNRKMGTVLLVGNLDVPMKKGRASFYGGINAIDVRSKNVVATLPNFWTGSPPVVDMVLSDSYSSVRGVIGARFNLKLAQGVMMTGQGQYRRDVEKPYRWDVDERYWDTNYGDFSVRIAASLGENASSFIGVNRKYDEDQGFGRANFFAGLNIMPDVVSGRFTVGISQSDRMPNSWERWSRHHVYAAQDESIRVYRHIMDRNQTLNEKRDSIFLAYGFRRQHFSGVFSLNRSEIYDMEYLVFTPTTFGSGAYPNPSTGQPYSAYLKVKKGDRAIETAFSGTIRVRYPERGLHGWLSMSKVINVDQPNENSVDRSKIQPDSTISAGLSWERSGYSISVQHSYVSGFTWESAEMVDTSKKIPAYNTTNILVRTPITGLGKTGKIFFGIKNVQGGYRDFRKVMEIDTALYAGIQLKGI